MLRFTGRDPIDVLIHGQDIYRPLGITRSAGALLVPVIPSTGSSCRGNIPPALIGQCALKPLPSWEVWC
jgi:hypothetical protein